MGPRRWAAAAAVVAVVSAGGAVPSDAGGPPATFNELFQSIPITVNGSYTPIVGALDCFDGGGDLAIIWYAPGSAPDWRWGQFDDQPSGLEHTTTPLTVNGTFTPFVGDFDGDGCDDVFWYAPGSGADFVWYGVPDGGFTSRSVTVSGSYTPLVGDWDEGTVGDDIFWYGEGGGTETIWRGTATRGTFGMSGAPQVNGSDFVASSFGGGALFYRPGSGADYFWDDIVAGASAPGESVTVAITKTYEPYFVGFGYLLYAPGSAQDKFIYSYSNTGSMVVGNGTINGTYRVAVPPPTTGFPLIVFHAPGTAQDYLWIAETTSMSASTSPDWGAQQ